MRLLKFRKYCATIRTFLSYYCINLFNPSCMFPLMYFKSSQRKALSNVIAPLAFWSYEKRNLKKVDDSQLIEAVLIHGNDALRKRLFKVYSSKKIQKIWEREIIIRGAHYSELNKKIASQYLNISNPDQYIARAYAKFNLYDRFSSADA
jgi:hypothetical protein